MGGETPATATVPGAAGGEAEKLSVGRLGLRARRHVPTSTLRCLPGCNRGSGAEAPGAIGEVLAQAVAEGIPSLQSQEAATEQSERKRTGRCGWRPARRLHRR